MSAVSDQGHLSHPMLYLFPHVLLYSDGFDHQASSLRPCGAMYDRYVFMLC